jgi:hypothetical protein
MIEFFKRAVAAWTQWMLVFEAEARTGVDQIEAAAVDDFQTDLASVASTPEERQRVRDMAILCAQLGLTEDDIQPMAQQYRILQGYGVDLDDIREFVSIRERFRRLVARKAGK